MANVQPLYRFQTRRSTVHSTQGIVSSAQPLASQAGIEILRQGGNAADAAVAVAATLNLTEPCSTGIGGDMFCLFYDAKANKVRSLNGSGRSSGSHDIKEMKEKLGFNRGEDGRVSLQSALSVTVPGAAAGWVDTVENLEVESCLSSRFWHRLSSWLKEVFLFLRLWHIFGLAASMFSRRLLQTGMRCSKLTRKRQTDIGHPTLGKS